MAVSSAVTGSTTTFAVVLPLPMVLPPLCDEDTAAGGGAAM